MAFRVSLYELLTNLNLNLCSHLPHKNAPTPVSSVTTIIDLEGASMSLLWTLRAHLQQASVLATANYPETLCATIVVGAPSFFSTVWGWAKVRLPRLRALKPFLTNDPTFQSWFDEGTRNKVHIVNKDQLSSIHALIDPKDLPKAYGGELDWKYEDPPALDEEAKAAVGGQWPKGPVWFKNGSVVYPSQDEQVPVTN